VQAYLDLANLVLNKGRNRTTSVQGIGNRVYTGHELRFEPDMGFPLLTTKNMKGSWKAIVAELLWFLSGSDDIKDLHRDNVHLWDAWATKEICDQYNLPEGRLGRIYGPQWRSWRGVGGKIIDQISNVIEEIKTRPDSKRMMVTSWNPAEVDDVFIAPCHGIFKFIVAEGIIDLCMMQRAADLPIGVPFNIASYALLHRMVAQVTGLTLGIFSHYLTDIHIYNDQIEIMKDVQLVREPRPLPRLQLNPDVKNIFEFKIEDFTLADYNPHPYIKYPVGV